MWRRSHPAGTSALIFPETYSNDNSFTYLFTPRYRLGPDLMTYARIASGYPPGGSDFGSSAVVPGIFAPDKTQNYEVGAKGEFLDRRLSLDASVFHILWYDIQTLFREYSTLLLYSQRQPGKGRRCRVVTHRETAIWAHDVLRERVPLVPQVR
jgi:outer membrane receptor protein involved in Fe transport